MIKQNRINDMEFEIVNEEIITKNLKAGDIAKLLTTYNSYDLYDYEDCPIKYVYINHKERCINLNSR